ncbi:MAG: hypothetical protein H7228_08005 [Polaromonas sp.]|nr:hypothetical protein [Polaromonas sp.]
MKLFGNKLLGATLLSVTAAAVLVACGGGDSTTPVAGGGPVGGGAPLAGGSPTTVASFSAAVATNIGATVIAGASTDEELYNIAANIGDSWQLVLNNKTNTYIMKVLVSQYGLTSTVEAPFTKTSDGTFTTIKSTNGTALNVQIDSRTKTLAGNATVGAKTASMSGSGYNVTSTVSLAGTYFFLGAVRNVSNGQFPDNPAGSFSIASNGTDITVCDNGIFVNGACVAVPNSGYATSTKLLKVRRDTANGLLRITDGVKDFGVLHVSAGDRGPVLILDRFGYNDENVLRAGVFFGGKAMKLAGTEFNGTFNCSINGLDSAVAVVTGTSYTVKNLVTARSGSGTLQYNKILSSNRQSAIDLDGAAIVQNNGELLSQADLLLPLSSSLAVISHNDGTLDICRRTSL